MNNNFSQDENAIFRLIFSDSKEILFLLKNVAKFSWVDRIQKDSIEVILVDYDNENVLKYKPDVIAKVTIENNTAYIFVFFVSKVPECGMRNIILNNMLLFWEKKIKEGTDKIPPIIPLVLYNGKEIWTEPREIY
ncbi:hypothetical protein Csac_1455 [Caldicellulosiruptor saccharolyticus DSM 8903]|uniref:Transposase (putative) YhgA-like domain-containing protein n=1 Tax=Caldicellulosiruptor saccharolyticus (strain ATCC 43494 / DSM 8903 / Tp8T 6331) TaxID=351627 RepID=A4XJH0_CALS8|nr:Rpn family recombination-promoting nuclease/putative transposase [Caldicellulosiruptor saccharolyticus]ABP67055.1 hypothetical protein Csac_1455 [Caldicellulosiruptor saccharolyticus DSM 8903]